MMGKEGKGWERKGREGKAREIDQSYCSNSWTHYLYAISILTFLILCVSLSEENPQFGQDCSCFKDDLKSVMSEK